jgi:hypothetical protein
VALVVPILMLARSIGNRASDINASLEQSVKNTSALAGLQTSTGKGVATPANWNVGDDVIIPATVSDEDATAKFGTFNKVLPYLRTAKLPS